MFRQLFLLTLLAWLTMVLTVTVGCGSGARLVGTAPDGLTAAEIPLAAQWCEDVAHLVPREALELVRADGSPSPYPFGQLGARRGAQ